MAHDIPQRYNSPAAHPFHLDRHHYMSQLGIPSRTYSASGYSSTELNDVTEDSSNEDDTRTQYARPQSTSHTGQSPPSSPHGIEHRPSIWDRQKALLEGKGPNQTQRPSIVQDTKWKLYDPQPFLSHLIHHGAPPKPPVPTVTAVAAPGDVLVEPPKKERHHHIHMHHHEPRKPAKVEFHNPAYAFSGRSGDSASFQESVNSSGSSADSYAPDELPLHPSESTLTENDEEDSESDSDVSVAKPPLGRRSSSNYKAELIMRRAQTTRQEPKPPIPSALDKIESQLANLKLGHRAKSHSAADGEQTYHDFKPSHYSPGARTRSFYAPEVGRITPKHISIAPNESDEEGPAYESLPSPIRAARGEAHVTPETKFTPPQNEDELLRRLSADGDAEAVDAALNGAAGPKPVADAPSAPSPFLFQTRVKSFSYDDYKNHFHGLLMTPEEEKKPGFSCKDCGS